MPTPLLGGAAIAIPSIVLCLVAGDAWRLAPILSAGAFMFLVGLTDDAIALKPATKLIAQIAVASLLVASGSRLYWVSSMTVDTVMSLVWLVGLTNAFNLLDNMDGLCAGVAGVALATLIAGSSAAGGIGPEERYLAILLGATLAFLLRNYYPASIFMGDAGSLFLGVTVAALALTSEARQSDRSNVLSAVIAPMLVVAIPIVDTTLVTISRMLAGRRVSVGGRDHSSHRLVVIGLTEPAAVGVLWALSAGAAVVAIVIKSMTVGWAGLLAAVAILAMAVFAAYLAQVKVYDESPNSLPHGFTPLVLDVMHKRRALEVLLDFCLVAICYFAAWRLRFDGPEWNIYFPRFLESLPFAISAQLVSFFLVGAYRGQWRHFGLMDGVVFIKGIALGSLGTVGVTLYAFGFRNYSRGVFIIFPVLLLLGVVGFRASFRLIEEFVQRRGRGRRLVIYGAGPAGALVIQELLGSHARRYRLLGFIDDDVRKRRLRLKGYAVLGSESDLMALVKQGAVDVVVVSPRIFDAARLERLQAACGAKNVQLLRVHFHIETLVSSES